MVGNLQTPAPDGGSGRRLEMLGPLGARRHVQDADALADFFRRVVLAAE